MWDGILRRSWKPTACSRLWESSLRSSEDAYRSPGFSHGKALANFAFFGGLAVIGVGVLLAILNLFVYLAGRRRQSGRALSTSSDYTPIEPG